MKFCGEFIANLFTYAKKIIKM